MRRNRTFFLICTACCAVVLSCSARIDPTRDPVDLDAVKEASLVPFCEFMKRQNPHIRNWKKGVLPTEKELAALIRRNPGIAKDLERIRGDFYREIETDSAKRDKFRKKDKKPKTRTKPKTRKKDKDR